MVAVVLDASPQQFGLSVAVMSACDWLETHRFALVAQGWVEQTLTVPLPDG